jgi:hypothetical protein
MPKGTGDQPGRAWGAALERRRKALVAPVRTRGEDGERDDTGDGGVDVVHGILLEVSGSCPGV